MAATASNSRPALVVGGALTPASGHRRDRPPARGVVPAHGEVGDLVGTHGRPEVHGRHPPRLSHGHVAARERDGGQVAEALEVGQVGTQDLAAPRGAVGAETHAVERHADDRSGVLVVGQAGGDVGVVVLHADCLDVSRLGQRPGERRRAEVRVQVVGHHLRTHGEQPAQVLDALLEGHEGLVVLQVAEVLGDHGPVVSADADRALQRRPARQRVAGETAGDAHRARGVAARPAHHDLAIVDHAGHRVVDPHVDGPVVGAEPVGDVAQARRRVCVAVDQRLGRAVGAGEHQRAAVRLGEQDVQRRGRQHHTERAVAGRHGVADRGAGSALEQDDRPLRRDQQILLDRADVGERSDHVEVGGEQGEGLLLPVLAPAQVKDCGLVRGVDGQVVPTQALHRHDVAGTEPVDHRLDHVTDLDRLERRIPQHQLGSARRTAGGLGVEAPVERVVVLGTTGGAHREPGHRGRGAVVGQTPHDAEPRSAVGAVEERVAVPAVGGVVQLGQAGRARSHVGGDRRRRVAGRIGAALHDPERLLAHRCDVVQRDVVHDGERRQSAEQPVDECADRCGRSLDLDEHAVAVVADEPGQTERGRVAVHGGPEPDALHDAGDRQAAADDLLLVHPTCPLHPTVRYLRSWRAPSSTARDPRS